MPGNFDELLDALAEVQAKRPGPTPKLTQPPVMAKALPQPARRASPKVRPEVSMPALLSQLKRMDASFGVENAKLAQDRKQHEFFKSLGVARATLGRRIAAGGISADDASLMEAGLNRLAQRGIELLAAEDNK
jgi:hypothetical protein